MNAQNGLQSTAIASGTLNGNAATAGEAWAGTGVRILASATNNSGHRFVLMDTPATPTLQLDSNIKLKFRARVALAAGASAALSYVGLHRATNQVAPAAPAFYYEISNDRLKAIRVNASGSTTVADVAITNTDALVLDIDCDPNTQTALFVARRVSGTPEVLIDASVAFGTLGGTGVAANIVSVRPTGFASAINLRVYSLGAGYYL